MQGTNLQRLQNYNRRRGFGTQFDLQKVQRERENLEFDKDVEMHRIENALSAGNFDWSATSVTPEEYKEWKDQQEQPAVSSLARKMRSR